MKAEEIIYFSYGNKYSAKVEIDSVPGSTTNLLQLPTQQG